jgi:hypothetical protein
MTNITNQATQFDTSNPDNVRHIYEFGQVDDDYRWNSLELSLGYIWPQYKPRSKNSVTIQTVMKKWLLKKTKAVNRVLYYIVIVVIMGQFGCDTEDNIQLRNEDFFIKMYNGIQAGNQYGADIIETSGRRTVDSRHWWGVSSFQR